MDSSTIKAISIQMFSYTPCHLLDPHSIVVLNHIFLLETSAQKLNPALLLDLKIFELNQKIFEPLELQTRALALTNVMPHMINMCQYLLCHLWYGQDMSKVSTITWAETGYVSRCLPRIDGWTSCAGIFLITELRLSKTFWTGPPSWSDRSSGKSASICIVIFFKFHYTCRLFHAQSIFVS